MTRETKAWERALARARDGDPSGLVYLLCTPMQEIATAGVDKKGARVWRFEFAPLPDDPALRRAIVDELMRERPKVRGKARSVERNEAELIRLAHRWRGTGVTAEASRAELARIWKLSPGTLYDILRRRKTYADDYQAQPKEAKRIARNKAR
jgi:hypothetical protein